MSRPTISLKLDPTADQVDNVLQPLVRFNWATHDTPQNFQPFILELTRQGDDTVVGGLVGMAEWDWLQLQYILVPEVLRRQGLGTALMHRAEAFAQERGCIGVWLDTFSFQAQGFFEKLGYSAFGTIADHPRGARRHFLAKRFGAAID